MMKKNVAAGCELVDQKFDQIKEIQSWQAKPAFQFQQELTVDGKKYKSEFQTMHTGNCASCLLLEIHFRDENGEAPEEPKLVKALCAALYEAKFKTGQGNSEQFSPGNWSYPTVTWIGAAPIYAGCSRSYVGDFFNFLVEEGIGLVMASPVHTNARYGDGKSAHLNQCWFWIPPSSANTAHTRKTIPGTGGIYDAGGINAYEDTAPTRAFAKVLNSRFAGTKQYAKAAEMWEEKHSTDTQVPVKVWAKKGT
jgi:hypothetical protein